jgi:hypothetical protein
MTPGQQETRPDKHNVDNDTQRVLLAAGPRKLPVNRRVPERAGLRYSIEKICGSALPGRMRCFFCNGGIYRAYTSRE